MAPLGSSHPLGIPVPQICRALCAGPWGIETTLSPKISKDGRWWEVGKIGKFPSLLLCAMVWKIGSRCSRSVSFYVPAIGKKSCQVYPTVSCIQDKTTQGSKICCYVRNLSSAPDPAILELWQSILAVLAASLRPWMSILPGIAGVDGYGMLTTRSWWNICRAEYVYLYIYIYIYYILYYIILYYIILYYIIL